MNYVRAENLSKSFGVKTLFENLNFSVNEGDKIAIVARNGSGKTTLLKIILGKEVASEGEVFVNKDIQIVLFDQEIVFDPKLTVEDYIMNIDSPAVDCLKKYHLALQSENSSELEQAMSEMEVHKAWDLENESKQILYKLNITNLSQTMGQLSGGELKRVALSKLLLETRLEHRHVLFILDEPTNHLDTDMVEWLEYYLSKANISLLLVSHDRYFLDNVCNKIWEMEANKLYIHQGKYDTYLENKMLREENTTTVVDKTFQLYKKELEWMRRQPKARTTKSKSRIGDFYETEKIAKTNLKKDELELNFKMQRLGNKILELKSINKQFGSKILINNFSFQFQRGDKIGIVGKNGAGKSTLLNIIQGIEKPNSGAIEVGETISFGYFSQKPMICDESERVIDFIKNIAENFPLADGRSLSASQFLKLFLFDEISQYAAISKLSGGEKRRLHLICILFKNPNFLIFDEPTNDLDLPTLSVLEDFLTKFQGCLLVVSHDRYFMDRVVDQVLAFEDEGNIKNFMGSFTEYRIQKQAQEQIEKSDKTEEIPNKIDIKSDVATNKRKLTFNETNELKTIETKLPKLEKERAYLVDQLQNSTEYEKISKLSTQLEEIGNELETLETRWLELQELMN